MKHHNKIIDDSCKYIWVGGIPRVDALISVYNREGVKARAQFNIKKVFTCEFYVKLKLLNILTEGSTKFSYHMIVNGNKPMAMGPAAVLVDGRPDEKAAVDINDFVAKRSAPTDFWGEYSLAKKQ